MGSFDCSHLHFNKNSVHICVVGVGALGSSVLQLLAEEGYPNVDVVDMDIVELDNLGYQLLFDETDIGKKKTDVVLQRLYGSNDVSNHRSFPCSVQSLSVDQLLSYDIVLGCVDNLETRSYINSVVVSQGEGRMVYIDGGSMGLGGQAQLIIPSVTPCFQCLYALFPDPSTELYPLCTIVSHPLLPEHCITYVKQILWEKKRPHDALDIENEEQIQWIYREALKRSQTFGIEGVTVPLTRRVVRNVIITHPETNYRIAGFMLEFVNKLVNAERIESNYVIYRGEEGEYVERFWMEIDSECSVCGVHPSQMTLSVHPSSQLQEMVDLISKQISHPFSLWMGTTPLYADKPRSIREATEKNLALSLRSLHLYDGDCLIIHSSSVSYTLTLQVIP